MVKRIAFKNGNYIALEPINKGDPVIIGYSKPHTEDLADWVDVIWKIYITPNNSKEERNAIHSLVPRIPHIVDFLKSMMEE